MWCDSGGGLCWFGGSTLVNTVGQCVWCVGAAALVTIDKPHTWTPSRSVQNEIASTYGMAQIKFQAGGAGCCR